MTVTGAPACRRARPSDKPGQAAADDLDPLHGARLAVNRWLNRPALALARTPARAGPESREFATAKTGAHADRAVVAGDGVAADQADQPAGQQRERGAARLAGHERVCCV